MQGEVKALANDQLRLHRRVTEEVAKIYLTPEDRKLLGIAPPPAPLSPELVNQVERLESKVSELMVRSAVTNRDSGSTRPARRPIVACERHAWGPKALGYPNCSPPPDYHYRKDEVRSAVTNAVITAAETFLRTCVECGQQQAEFFDDDSYDYGEWFDD